MISLFTVAAFTDRPFSGNPAGVCILDDGAPDAWMGALARELGQPVTAFILRRGETWDLRWFSPEVEVDLCGHATLAAAHVLWERGLAADPAGLEFSTGSGPLRCVRDAERRVTLDFPTLPGEVRVPPPELVAAAGREPAVAALHTNRWLFEYDRADDLRAIAPDFAALKATGIRSLIVTAPSDRPNLDVISRNFAPIIGIDEDAVTGVAHTCLGPHWAPNTNARGY